MKCHKLFTAFLIATILFMLINPFLWQNKLAYGTSLFTDGFETGTLTNWNANYTAGTGDISVTTETCSEGTYSLKSSWSTGSSKAFAVKGFGSYTTVYAKMTFKIDVIPISTTQTKIFSILNNTDEWDTTGVLALWLHNSSGVADWMISWMNVTTAHYNYISVPPPIVDTWITVELNANMSLTNGAYALWVNDTLAWNVTENINTYNYVQASSIKVGCVATSDAQANVLYCDDITVSDTYIPFPNSAPTYSDIAKTTTVAGASCNFSVKWTADQTNMSYFIAGTNNTGSWVNDTATLLDPVDSAVSWSNFTKTLNALEGNTVGWEIWANDTSDLWSNTGLLTFTVTTSMSFGTPALNTTVGGLVALFSLQWTELAGGEYLDTYTIGSNNTGHWVNGTTGDFPASQTVGWSNTTLTLNSTAGTTIALEVWANDTANVWGDTDLIFYTTTSNAVLKIYMDYSGASTQYNYYNGYPTSNVNSLSGDGCEYVYGTSTDLWTHVGGPLTFANSTIDNSFAYSDTSSLALFDTATGSTNRAEFNIQNMDSKVGNEVYVVEWVYLPSDWTVGSSTTWFSLCDPMEGQGGRSWKPMLELGVHQGPGGRNPGYTTNTSNFVVSLWGQTLSSVQFMVVNKDNTWAEVEFSPDGSMGMPQFPRGEWFNITWWMRRDPTPGRSFINLWFDGVQICNQVAYPYESGGLNYWQRDTSGLNAQYTYEGDLAYEDAMDLDYGYPFYTTFLKNYHGGVSVNHTEWIDELQVWNGSQISVAQSITLTVTAPTATTYTTSSISVILSAEGGTIDKIWWNCKNGTSWIYGSNQTYTDSTSMSGFVNGSSYTFYTWANNTVGNQDNMTIAFTVAIPPTPPLISSHPTIHIPTVGLKINEGTKLHDSFNGYWFYTIGVTATVKNWFTDNWFNYTVSGNGQQQIYNGTEPTDVWIDGINYTKGTGWSYGAWVYVTGAFYNVSIKWGTTYIPPIIPPPVVPPALSEGSVVYQVGLGGSVGFQYGTEIVLFTVSSGVWNGTGSFEQFEGRGSITYTATEDAALVMTCPERFYVTGLNCNLTKTGAGYLALIETSKTIQISWDEVMPPIIPFLFIFGMIGLTMLITGPVWAWHKIKEKEYLNGLISGLILMALGFGFFIGWLFS